MSVKRHSKSAKREIQMTRNAIQRSWSGEERLKRRRIAKARQQRLLSVLFSKQAAIPVQVA
ncbi:MAG: hypothetical protein IH899_08600 [Planctomycetes bacterium]|nr:hypothetical protein [Planctomycetota bacterium]